MKELNFGELKFISGGGPDGLGPFPPPSDPETGVDPFILEQLRRLKMYGTI